MCVSGGGGKDVGGVVMRGVFFFVVFYILVENFGVFGRPYGDFVHGFVLEGSADFYDSHFEFVF